MVRAWDIHFETVFNAWAPLETFANTYVSLLGGSRADAAALIHGFSETTQRLETDLRTLTAVAAASPEDARLLAESPPRVRAPGRFADALADFLTEHGHMGHNCMLDTAPWDEDPAPLLNEIAKRLADERPRPGGRDPMQVRVDLARRGLSEPDRAQFDQALEVALRDGSLTEEHATYIDQMLGQRMRRLVMKAARRLTEAGVLDDERDVVHLHHDEVARLLTEPVDMRALVAERRLQLEEWRRTRPAKRLGGVVEQAAPPPADGILSGVAASPGTARGPAKVVLGHDAFEKVRPGDVMVCKSTHPAFTPVMAISAAVVTSSGDLFSHAAVESRELGIPAVVGVAGACDVIAEGRMVEVDGDAGVVRLL
jgi:pyruvate,water dikinase